MTPEQTSYWLICLYWHFFLMACLVLLWWKTHKIGFASPSAWRAIIWLADRKIVKSLLQSFDEWQSGQTHKNERKKKNTQKVTNIKGSLYHTPGCAERLAEQNTEQIKSTASKVPRFKFPNWLTPDWHSAWKTQHRWTIKRHTILVWSKAVSAPFGLYSSSVCLHEHMKSMKKMLRHVSMWLQYKGKWKDPTVVELQDI